MEPIQEKEKKISVGKPAFSTLSSQAINNKRSFHERFGKIDQMLTFFF
jgi:hypothetical protein